MISLSPALGGNLGSRRNFQSPVKKGRFVSSTSGGTTSNLYCIRVKNQHFLVVFAEDEIIDSLIIGSLELNGKLGLKHLRKT